MGNIGTMSEKIELIRALVRPYLTILFGTVLAGLAIYLMINFASPDIASLLIGAFVGSTGTIIAFWFGDRIKKNGQVQ